MAAVAILGLMESAGESLAGAHAHAAGLGLNGTCEDVLHQANGSAAAACALALTLCSGTGSSVNYMAVYTCVFGGGTDMSLGGVAGVLTLIALLLSCFVSVAAVAGGFLCANLSSMAALLSLSETVAGVTLAALGNGAPDIFATYSAVRAGAGAMALGELLGAALFVTLVVVGGVALVSPETALPRRPFLRDLVFLIGCVAIILYITFTGTITFALSIFFLVYYFVYVATVVVSHFLHRNPTSTLSSGGGGGHGAGHGHAMIADIHDVDAIDDAHNFDAHNARESLANPIESNANNPHYDDFYTIESPHAFTTFDGRGATLVPTHALGINTTARIRGASNFVPHLNKELFPFLAEYSKPDNEEEDDDAAASGGEDSAAAVAAAAAAQARRRPSLLHKFLAKLDKKRPLLRALRHTIVPYLAKWDSMDLRERAFSLWSTPIGCCLKLTIPVVHRVDVEKVRLLEGVARTGEGNGMGGGELAPLLDRGGAEEEEGQLEEGLMQGDDEGAPAAPSLQRLAGGTIRSKVLMTESDRYLVAMQLFFGSQFAGSKLMETGEHGTNSLIWVSSLAIGSLFAFVSFITSKNMTMPTIMRYNMLCLFGFIISITWVYTIANEVVGLLNTLGIILHIDEVVLGLTIFAIGNCTGDLMTNLSIARMGYPKMALGACFGSPMMNFLLGLGISTLSISSELEGGVYRFETGDVLRKSTIYLLASLVTTLCLIAASGFKTNAQIGKIMLGEYVVIVLFILIGNSFESKTA